MSAINAKNAHYVRDQCVLHVGILDQCVLPYPLRVHDQWILAWSLRVSLAWPHYHCVTAWPRDHCFKSSTVATPRPIVFSLWSAQYNNLTPREHDIIWTHCRHRCQSRRLDRCPNRPVHCSLSQPSTEHPIYNCKTITSFISIVMSFMTHMTMSAIDIMSYTWQMSPMTHACQLLKHVIHMTRVNHYACHPWHMYLLVQCFESKLSWRTSHDF